MKKTIVLCMLALVTVTGCGAQTADDTAAVSQSVSASTEASSADDGTGMINPFVDYESVEAAEEHLDFSVTVPESIDGYEETAISVMDDSMFQIIYRSENDEICIRKAAGSEDISGDYNEYSEVDEAAVGDIALTLRGDAGKIRNVTWTDQGYTYSIYSVSGLEKDAVLDLVEQIQ